MKQKDLVTGPPFVLTKGGKFENMRKLYHVIKTGENVVSCCGVKFLRESQSRNQFVPLFSVLMQPLHIALARKEG